MRVKEVELAAAKKQKCPEYASVPERCLYFALLNIYVNYHKGDISKTNAVAEKQKLIAECNKFEEQYLNWCQVHKAYQDNIRKAGMKLSDIEKSEDITEIAFTACEAIGLMTGDCEFANRQISKFGRT